MDKQTLLVALIAGFAVLTIILALMLGDSKNNKSAKRIKNMQVDAETKAQTKARQLNEKTRRKSRENALKSVEEQRDANKKMNQMTLAKKMKQADMEISMRSFYLISIAVGFFVGFITLTIPKIPFYAAIGIGFVAGYGLPRWYISFRIKQRLKKFTAVFPNAVDIIVRGIRSGLPLNDCIRIIGQDTEEPVRSEFRKMTESMQMGITVPEACERLYQNVPTPETNFFAIVVAIQSSAGGNLAEALNNLSKVLRERRKLSDKIKACSQEAKTSATIIGSLPFVVGGLISLSSPGYLDPLFQTGIGNNILIGSAIAMALGIFVMKQMINFKF